MKTCVEVADGLYAVDVNYMRRGLASCWLAVEDAGAALIDNGGANAPDAVRAAFDELGLPPEALQTQILTHIHLDHAAATGHIMQMNPAARLVMHPQGMAHMADPEDKLAPAARQLYGREFCDLHYGKEIPATARERIDEAKEGEAVKLGARRLRVVYTPGHAWDHLSILDEKTGAMMAGDAFGISFGELDGDNGPLAYPATAPSQFNEKAMRASFDKIAALKPALICFSHFGALRENMPRRNPNSAETNPDSKAMPNCGAEALCAQLHENLTRMMNVAAEVFADDSVAARQKAHATAARFARMFAEDIGEDADALEEALGKDLWLMAAGLVHRLQRDAEKGRA